MYYTVQDSSVIPSQYSRKELDGYDHSIRIGMVRRAVTLDSGEITYEVDVASGGKQIPVSCVFMRRFGGVYNFEDFILRPWAGTLPTNNLPGGTSVSKHAVREGDVVLVAYIEGQSREGVILGGLGHPARASANKAGDIEYNSRFNGLETIIKKNGSYQVLFHGESFDDLKPVTPPTGIPILKPTFNPAIEGSYYGFSKLGSYVSTDGSGQFLKIGKETKQVTIASGSTTITLSDTLGLLSIKTSKTAIKSDDVLVKSTTVAVDTVTLSLKATQVAIGNDQIELIDGITQLIDMLGTLVITSPTGTCLPFSTAPSWAPNIEPLKIKLLTLKTSLKQPGIDPALSLSPDKAIDIS